ncbi:DDE superfamily endonuclease domain-containing protein [Phthorimaea operculella]|nr:DDE superfamily endonuclease domain-containing protein [Phthorimaea operculella]
MLKLSHGSGSGIPISVILIGGQGTHETEQLSLWNMGRNVKKKFGPSIVNQLADRRFCMEGQNLRHSTHVHEKGVQTLQAEPPDCPQCDGPSCEYSRSAPARNIDTCGFVLTSIGTYHFSSHFLPLLTRSISQPLTIMPNDSDDSASVAEQLEQLQKELTALSVHLQKAETENFTLRQRLGEQNASEPKQVPPSQPQLQQDDGILRQLFMRRLPEHLQAILAASADPLDDIAARADKILEVAPGIAVSSPRHFVHAAAAPANFFTKMVLTSSSESSDEEYIGQIQPRRRQRTFKSRLNFSYTVTDFTFNEKFRVCKATVEYLINRIGSQIEHGTNRNFALTPDKQIMCALHWMGCGAQYHVIADAHGLSKGTVHNCVKRVCGALISTLFGEEVRWPENCNRIPLLFMRYNIPRIAGIVDGSLIKIDAPHQNESAYVDRDGNHSINTMVVCGPNLDIFYASARWPGSVHDARVMRCSSLARVWESGWRPFPNAIILGDSGYGLKKWLLTPNIPIQIPRTVALERFLRAFKSTRRMVENSLGIIKEKFPCLNYLRVQPQIASNVILSCVLLHNIEKRLGSEYYTPYIEEGGNENVNDFGELENDLEEVLDEEAVAVLQSLIQLFE